MRDWLRQMRFGADGFATNHLFSSKWGRWVAAYFHHLALFVSFVAKPVQTFHLVARAEGVN
jgi:hypothetical protein